MVFRTLFVACALFFVALAQSTELRLEGMRAHFKNAQLVPVPIPVFEPTAILDVNFPGLGSITPGQLVSKNGQNIQGLSHFPRLNESTEVTDAPNLTLTPANSTVTFNGNYTVAMIDPGAVGSGQSNGQMRHWLINGAGVSSESPIRPPDRTLTSSCQTTSSHLKVPLQSPNTPGPLLLLVLGHTGQCMNTVHLPCLLLQRDDRYTIVVHAQGNDFTPPQSLSGPVPGVGPFDFPGYVKNTNLGPLVAGIYYTVEEGTATVSIPATSSVVSSTLSAANSGTSSSTSGGSKPTNTSTSNNSGGAMGNVISGSLLGFAAVLTYITL